MKNLFQLLVFIALLSCQGDHAPRCRITQPLDNAVFMKGGNILISVDAEDQEGSISEVSLSFDHSIIVSLYSIPYNYTLSSGQYTPGIHVIGAVAEDNSGLTASDEVQISIVAASPKVTTGEVTEITQSSAKCGGNVVIDGGEPVTGRGVCWSTSPNPDIADNTTVDGSGKGSYSSSISGLDPDTKYYIRAYAINSQGTGYGNVLSFTTLDFTGETVTDYDGNVYYTVQIGDQIWMQENLKVTHYSDGTEISGFYWYNNDEVTYKNEYGALYKWSGLDLEKVCPSGWHVSSSSDWSGLTDYLGGTLVAGGQLKEVGTYHWNAPNTGASDVYGFSALPGGMRNNQGTFEDKGDAGYWWTSEYKGSYVFYKRMNYTDEMVFTGYRDPTDALSIRCVKDQ
jgi:uncharacterized protein (TIGR02145 family)